MRSRLLQSYENADGAAFAVECSDKVADVAGFDVAAFDLNDDAFCFAGIVVNENLNAVSFPRRTGEHGSFRIGSIIVLAPCELCGHRRVALCQFLNGQVVGFVVREPKVVC